MKTYVDPYEACGLFYKPDSIGQAPVDNSKLTAVDIKHGTLHCMPAKDSNSPGFEYIPLKYSDIMKIEEKIEENPEWETPKGLTYDEACKLVSKDNPLVEFARIGDTPKDYEFPQLFKPGNSTQTREIGEMQTTPAPMVSKVLLYIPEVGEVVQYDHPSGTVEVKCVGTVYKHYDGAHKVMCVVTDTNSPKPKFHACDITKLRKIEQ